MQVAALEQPCPGLVQRLLGLCPRAAGRRGDMFDETEPATRTQHPGRLGEHGVRVGDGATSTSEQITSSTERSGSGSRSA